MTKISLHSLSIIEPPKITNNSPSLHIIVPIFPLLPDSSSGAGGLNLLLNQL